MSDVRVGLDQVVRPDDRDETAAFGAAMDGDKLPDLVSIADFKPRALTLVFEVLCGDSNGRKRMEHIVSADRGGALDNDLR